MKTYTLTMSIQTDNFIDEEEIRQQIYNACNEVPFSFDITNVAEEK
ncbi:hypothetical protein [Streptomyces parvulus]|nr:hypothetical protein [Streptomyces parvulus]